MKLFNTCASIGIALLFVQGVQGQLTDGADNRDNRKQYMETSGVIVDVCVYEQEWVPPKDGEPDAIPFKEGTLIQRAVVTGVHKGNVEIGTKIDIVEIITDPPEYMTKFRSVVEGELLTWFYFGEKLPKPKNGRHIIDHNHMSFKWGKDKEVIAYLEALGIKTKYNKANKSEMATPRKPSD
ncbi:hypothetical protein [Luteolibacter sp. AS25]|uniref:hypothetical protein n=1 Tax=Luteolibacter sp. AS25 TaxID=3135776 RepID=UPI00398AFE1C